MKQILVQQIEKTELFELMKDAVSEVFKVNTNNEFERKIFSKKETAEILNRSESFVRTLVTEAILQTTADGKFISGYEINRYLRINNEKTAPSETEAV